jgi:FkbM family methyltransferase
MNIEVPEQVRLNASRINNVALQKAVQESVRDGTKVLRTAIAELRLAVATNPLDLGIRMNLATYLHEICDLDGAEAICSFVLKHDERCLAAWQIMGSIHAMRGRLSDSIACNQRCYDIDPSSGSACWGLTEAHLRAGDWAAGLPLYERRDEILPRVTLIPNAPRWDGSKTGHLAVWPDQGFGDSLIFARFLPWARERCDKLTVMVAPEMLPLMGGFMDLATVKTGVSLDDHYDHQIRISSLPLVYGLTPDNIPPDPGLVTAAEFTGHLDGDFKIGIAWQGNPKFPADRLRSIPFAEFLPFGSDPRNTLYSLQVGPAAKDIALHEAQSLVRDMSGVLAGDWARTAAIVKQLDLVVSSCTAVVHLAGSLGVRCFVMLPAAADWRWLSGRDDTPWYPHTRLFRQTTPGDWSGVVKRVQVAIDQFHEQRNMTRLLNKQISSIVPFNPKTMVDMRAPGTIDEKEPDVARAMRKILRPGDTFIDVGANVGMHTALAAELVGIDGKVIAVEPGENALPELRRKCEGLPQVYIIQNPAWSLIGDVEFYLCADGSGGNAVWDPGKFPINHQTRANPSMKVMRATTLDAVCARHAPRLIKIDTEGAEQRILEGASDLLSGPRAPPFIIAEFHEFGLRELGCSFDSLRDLMGRHGYQTFHLFPDGSRPWRVPDGERLRAPKEFIINLLFSTEAEVNALWTEAPSGDYRTVYGFRIVSEPIEDHVKQWAGAA